MICGTCGSFWSTDSGEVRKNMSNDERDENIAKVAAMADPKCWVCHDSGWIESPIDEPRECDHGATK